MSTAPTPPKPPAPEERELRIYGHTKLFYWWPVWLVCFIFATMTWYDGQRLAIIPADSTVKEEVGQYVISAKTAKPLPYLDDAVKRQADSTGSPFKVRISPNHSIGAIFVIVFLLVAIITNVPLRGLWSVIVIVILGLGTIIISLVDGWWNKIFSALGDLHIHINLAGYLFIGLGLFVVWLFTMYFFDRQIYMVFTPGQLKVCLEIGGGETAYDTMGMVIQRQRDDLFRHWILGLGSGDLIVRTSGAHSHEFHMENVLNVSSKLHAIEEMMREKSVVKG
ncbi:MAG: hypothetical protein K1X57_04885 [Gemmataceae bacterium]|nr:hypothetical protein [Gemmataceae bacterium]